mgnify:CR=1 FL=1
MQNRVIVDVRSITTDAEQVLILDGADGEQIKGKKVVLNKSLLDQNNVRKFESEAKCAIFHNIPPLDDKMDRHRILDELLNKLGFDKNRPTDNGRAAKLFGIVKE